MIHLDELDIDDVMKTFFVKFKNIFYFKKIIVYRYYDYYSVFYYLVST